MSTKNAIFNAFNFFDQVFHDFPLDNTSSAEYSITTGGSTWGEPPHSDWYTIPTNVKVYDSSFPPMNVWVSEETKDLVLEFAVAGIPKDHIIVDFEGDKMTLEIESQIQEREGFVLSQKGIRSSKSKTYYTVPQSKYETGKAKAELRDGILIIAIPAREDQRPKRLLIES